jgi:threonine dehydrogenase-like Zn-dependent dehydrogenase
LDESFFARSVPVKAVCWHGKGNVQVDTVPDPKLHDGGDVIVKVTSTAICGSDLHLYGGMIPAMETGDILGHEFMGEVVDVGRDVKKLKVGDRVVVPFVIACGECHFCKRGLWSACERTNPDAEKLKTVYGHAGAGLFGYSHLYGGYAGGQAEYVRVPHADHGPIKVPQSLRDDQVLFLSDILPTGWMAAENAGIERGDTIAVWGCGPVGQMAIVSALAMGAERVFAIDRVPERLAMARARGNVETIDFMAEDVYDRLQAATQGRGPHACIDAVGLEAHGLGSFDAVVDRVKTAVYLGTDRLHALRQCIHCCRPGGTVSVPGVYAGFLDKMPFGAAFGKGLTLKGGQTHAQRYLQPLLARIEASEIDPSFVVTHQIPMHEAPKAYETFRDKTDGCIKVVMTP